MQTHTNRLYFGRDLEAMSSATNYHKWIIEEFKPFLGENVAEVGAGTGNFSKLLTKYPEVRSLVAFEPSENMFPLLQDCLSGAKKVETLNSYFGDEYEKFENSFDSIIYVNVLEHIEDNKKELSYVRKGLKEGGYVLVFVPALSWLYSEFDKKVGHFRRYHKKDLIQLINTAGFKIIKVKYFDFAGIIPWYVIMVLLKKSLSGSNVSLYDKFVVPIMKRIESIIHFPIGKNLLLVAKK